MHWTNTESKGFGDTVEKFTQATGIAQVVKAVIPNCGCEDRKNKLNEIFPYGKTN